MPDFVRRAMEAKGMTADEIEAVARQAAELNSPPSTPAAAPAEPDVQPSLLSQPVASATAGGEEDATVLPLVAAGAEGGEDHELRARATDPAESHAASANAQAREGSTKTFSVGAHKHLILNAYAAAPRPLTDYEAWTAAGLSARSSAWHRCTDLLDAGAIEFVDTTLDAETGQKVRRCRPTAYGLRVLAALNRGYSVKPGDEFCGNCHTPGYRNADCASCRGYLLGE